MIEENLISNFEISKEDDFGLASQNQQLQQKRISKMNTHEPTTNYQQIKANLKIGDDENNNISNSNVDTVNHKYRKTHTSGSLESSVFIKGNLVFANAAGGSSNNTTPRKFIKADQNLQKIAYPSSNNPALSKETQVKYKGKDISVLNENENYEESTDEKMHNNQSNSESGSQDSNKARESPQLSEQVNLSQVLQYEQNSSNQVEVSQNESALHVNRSNMKSRFSKNKVSVSAFKKETSFSNPDQENNSEKDNQNSPQSLEYLQQGTQVVLIQSHSHLPLPPETILKHNSQQDLTVKDKDKVQFSTPAQRRKSQLNKIEVKQFQTLADKKKDELAAIDPQSPMSAKEKFKIAGTVARTLSRLQTNQVSRIESTEQLEAEIGTLKKRYSQNKDSDAENKDNPARNSDVNNAFNMVRMVETICELSERGHPEDIKNIITILQKDPKRYLRSSEDPQHLLNKLNSKSQNASYLACKNGNINIVQFLVKQECNFNIKSKIGGEIEDFPLQAATRWNHKEIIEFLLTQRVIKISQQQIEAAYKEAKQNKEIKKILSLHLKKKPFFFCC